METYGPQDGSDKVELGHTSEPVSFLGCEIRPGSIRPGRKSWTRLVNSIEKELGESKRLMNDPEMLVARHMTLIETLNRCGNIVKGWGSQYKFCNDDVLMGQIDEKIDALIRSYIGFYTDKRDLMVKKDKRNNRRLLGVPLIVDCKSDPIIPSNE